MRGDTLGLFDKIFRPKDEHVKSDNFWQTFTAYQPQFYSVAGQVYEVLLVRAAIDFRARQNAKLKVELTGSANERLRTLIQHKPSQWQTWYKFLYRVSTILDVQNNCIIVPILDDYGRITGYYPVLPSVTELVSVDGEPYLRYQFQNGQTAAMELSRCGIINKYQYLSDFFGENNAALDSTMQLISMNEQNISEAVKQSATFRFMAKASNFAKSADMKKEQERFAQTSMTGSGGIILLPNTYTDIQQIKSSAYNVDQAELELINGNVFSYFGVNEKLLQSLATADELDGFFNCCVEPFEIQLSEVLTDMTFTGREQSNGNRVQVTANRLQYASLTQRIDMAKELGDRGMIMRDEIRELFNLPPLPDGIGQTAPVRGEYYNAGDPRPADNKEGKNDEAGA
jgi:HK97 family phage portal protein